MSDSQNFIILSALHDAFDYVCYSGLCWQVGVQQCLWTDELFNVEEEGCEIYSRMS